MKSEEKQPKTVQKVSSGCGPSPPPDHIQEPESNIQQNQFEPIVATESSRKVSTGTSPPPQDMSTQTYDVLPITRNEENVMTHQDHPNHGIRRSQSMVAQTPLINQNDSLRRSYSRQSFSSDTQVKLKSKCPFL